MGEFRFSWVLSGSGWATVAVADGASAHTGPVSYCTDALADLLHAVAGLYGPLSTQRVSFDLEPQEVRWVFRVSGTQVDLAIREFPDATSSFDAPDDSGALRWRTVQPRSAVGHAVVRSAQALVRQHGEAGYLERWVRHPFPMTALQDLRRLHVRDDGCSLPHDGLPSSGDA
ncbi:hypothetical protein [Streptomyces lonarensis]|uniref:Uncharacterized protein n=1 Tax=Streptomyces lonarensis TaxID=700599 RepID=A0A7X6D3S1_9ACTN|nr:hypothetical protein [Streptomyces lonarensis]NJQ07637.1 hypothetical protein [Streptomyces lonarensis]